jgi:hypothetical protein
MKTKAKFNRMPSSLMMACSFFLVIFFALSCSKEDNTMNMTSQDNEQTDLKCKLTFHKGDIFHLSGMSLYKTWMVKGGKVLQDNKWDCIADLEILQNQNIKFTFSETAPGRPAGIVCYGKMSPSGILTFKYPVPVVTFPDGTGLNITDIIKMHACATIWGNPGFKENSLFFWGRFDGKKFTATAPFMAKIVEYCPSASDLFETPVDGPVHWIFGYDLNVVK